MYIYKVLPLVPCGLCGHYEGREDMKKELWLKVSSEAEYLQKEADILSVLKAADVGEDRVVMYCAKENSVKTLKYGVQVSEELIAAFTTLLGDQCVKVVEKRIMEDADKEFKEYAEDKLRRMDILRNMGYTTDQAIKLMTCFCLEEIMDAIVSPYGDTIAESLSALAECVDEVPTTSYTPGYTFFRIGGGVDTGY